jgi:hypothetical protein
MVPADTPDFWRRNNRFNTDASPQAAAIGQSARGAHWVSLLIVAVWCLVFLGGRLQAQTIAPKEGIGITAAPTQSTPDFFENRGRWDFGAQLACAVENAIPRNISHINLLIAQPQVGLIVTDR